MLSKVALYKDLATKNGLTKQQVSDFFESLQVVAVSEALSGGFSLPGFGKLKVADRKERMVRNPATGESKLAPAKRVLKFRIAKSLKDAVFNG